MPTDAKPKPKGKGLGKKLGPLPLWAWAVIGGVSVGAVWWYMGRNKQSTGVLSTTGSTGVSPQDTTQGGYPSAATPPGQGLDQQTLQDALSQALSSSGIGQFESWAQGTITQNENAIQSLQDSLGSSLQGIQDSLSALASVAPLSSLGPNPNQGGATKQRTGKSAPSRTSRVVSRKKLKSGATVTTYSSGRKVEQAPGRSPYVIYDPAKARAKSAAKPTTRRGATQARKAIKRTPPRPKAKPGRR